MWTNTFGRIFTLGASIARTVLQASVARAENRTAQKVQGFMDDEAVANIIATAT